MDFCSGVAGALMQVDALPAAVCCCAAAAPAAPAAPAHKMAETRIALLTLAPRSFQGMYRCAIGNGRPKPKALEVIFSPGAACLRLYSLRSTSQAMSRTSLMSKP